MNTSSRRCDWFSGCLTHLDPIEFHVKAFDGLQPLTGLHVFGISWHSYVHGDLEVVLFLTHKCIVSQGEVETLICVHPIGRHRTGEAEREKENSI